jgi:hypothetical protein
VLEMWVAFSSFQWGTTRPVCVCWGRHVFIPAPQLTALQLELGFKARVLNWRSLCVRRAGPCIIESIISGARATVS